MTRAFTSEHDQEIARRYLAGESSVDIGRDFGVSVTPILRSLRRSKIPIRAGGRVSTLDFAPENRARIIAAYEAGAGIRSLARQYKVSDKQIHRILEEEGIPHVQPGGRRRLFDEQTTKQIVNAYQAGATTTQLAEQYDTNHITIRNYLVRAGITLRKGGPSLFWTEERKAEAARRFLAGESLLRIGDAFGIHEDGVASVLRALGHDTRKLPRWGDRNHAWKGGRSIDSSGYARIKAPLGADELVDVLKNGYVLEHRLVMAQKLGRRLRDDETVHHINGDKQDNRPENLQLRQGHHGKGVVVVCLDCGSSNVGHTPLG